ncbi:MAG: UvrD-helicase domain-containing protein, partial [Alistipes sp.]
MLTIYQASAGSGKTFNLAYEYIKLLLGRKTEQGRYLLRNQGRFHHRAILAITFTNKATDEMKRRIVRELALLSHSPLTDGEQSKYEPMLLDEFGCTPGDLAEASRKALVELLNDFTFFNVSTIDAFFQTVLRTFAREAELSGNFEVELSDTYAISTAVDTLLASVRGSATAVQNSKCKVQNNSDLCTSHLELDKNSALCPLNSALYDSSAVIQNWIVRFMLSEMRAGRAFNLFNRTSRIHEAIIGFITRLSNETLKRRYDEMADYLADPSRVVRLDEALAARLDALDNSRRDACRRLVTALAARGLLDKYLKAHVINPLRKYADGSRPDKLSATLRKAIDDPAGQSYLKGATPDPALHALLCEALGAVADAAAGEPTLRATRANLFALGILGSVFSIMSQFRADNNLILLSDTNGLLSDIISTDETPFIYERLGMQLRHFLIDEFQDTSRLQWDNLAPLLAESLSHDHDNLIIGDPKQSIYRFRNASPELLRSEVARRFPREAVTRSSDTNWRSARGIVEFNNDLFRALAANLGVEDIYTTVAQRVSPPHADRLGDVRLVPIEADTAADFTPLALDATVAEINRLLALGTPPGDIVLLTRTNPEARTVIDHLRHALPALPILSDEALLVSAAPSVRLLLALLRVQSSKFKVQNVGALYIAPAATNAPTPDPTN